MNIKVDNYLFDKTARTVTLLDFELVSLARIVTIVNSENNVMMYNFAGSGKGGSVSGNVVTLDYDTSSMANTDKLQIIYDDEHSALMTQIVCTVKRLFQVMANPPWVDKTTNQMRAQITGSLTTAGTVSTVTSITTFGSYPAQQGIIDQNRCAWAVLVRSRIG